MCNKEKFWTALAEAVGKPEWATDPEYSTFAARLKNREQVTQELDAVLTTATTAEWISRLGGKVPIAPVYDVQQALENPFVAEQQLVLDFHIPTTARFAELPRRLALRTARAPDAGGTPIRRRHRRCPRNYIVSQQIQVRAVVRYRVGWAIRKFGTVKRNRGTGNLLRNRPAPVVIR